MSSETADGGHMENYTPPVDPSKPDGTALASISDGSPKQQQQQLPPPATTTTTTATNLTESAKQQQDREFFRKFLQPNSPGREYERAAIETSAPSNHEESIRTMMNVEAIPQSCSTTIQASSGSPEATKTIENLLNQTAAANTIGRPTTSWSTAPYSSVPPIYSTFGFDMGYRPAASSSNNNNNNNHLESNQLQSTATSLIYDGLFADGGGGGVEDIFRGGLLSSDNLSLSTNPTTIKGGGTYNCADILGRSYAESQQLSILQQQQQDQLLHEQVGNLSLFDSNDRPNDHSNFIRGDFRQQANNYHQPPNAQASSRLLNSFMSNTFNQSYPSSSSAATATATAPASAAQYQVTNAVSSLGAASGYHRYGGSGSMTASSRSNNTPPHQRDGSDKIHPHPHHHHNFVTATTINSSNKSRRNKLPFFAGNIQQHSTSEHSGQQQYGGLKLDAYGSMNSATSGGNSSSNNNNNNINNNNNNNNGTERFSRKVFVGGLPPDIDEEEIKASFRRFGALVVDWPHKAESKSYFPPKGYAFLLFQEELSVQALIDACFQEDDKLYLCVSSPTIKDKPVQIRPWRLSDTDFVLDSTRALDPRKTVFVGGVPRPLKASELANIMNNLYGGVCYAGIDTDPELKYPKGAGRVAFSNYRSYITAISARFVHIQHSEIEKQVEVKPYVLDDQFCDECQDSRGGNKFAPFFCANITCLRYYCDNCWSAVHSQAGKELHKPLVKEGGDRPRGAQSFRW